MLALSKVMAVPAGIVIEGVFAVTNASVSVISDDVDGFVHADQTAELYNAPNQFNPHEARASKKKAKKQQKRASGEAYDFAEAFGAKAAV